MTTPSPRPTTDDGYKGAMGIRIPGDGYVYAVDTSRGLMIFKQP